LVCASELTAFSSVPILVTTSSGEGTNFPPTSSCSPVFHYGGHVEIDINLESLNWEMIEPEGFPFLTWVPEGSHLPLDLSPLSLSLLSLSLSLSLSLYIYIYIDR
jgi:hypothetical protein